MTRYERTTLNELFTLIRDGLGESMLEIAEDRPIHRDFRPGDVRHSLAHIGKIGDHLGYEPTHTLRQGLEAALGWCVERLGENHVRAAI